MACPISENGFVIKPLNTLGSENLVTPLLTVGVETVGVVVVVGEVFVDVLDDLAPAWPLEDVPLELEVDALEEADFPLEAEPLELEVEGDLLALAPAVEAVLPLVTIIYFPLEIY
tara:strand:+ start:179 stop:523 length:345 start_codon:yes stop_codon:yes gene_type:complete